MYSLEATLYDITRIFLVPALGLILLALVFALFSLGAFVVEGVQRRRPDRICHLAAYQARTGARSDDLELVILKKLEGLRIVSRSAPMLGLVATMIPMGPALLAMGQGNSAGIGENLVVAFSGVTLALVAASIAHMVLTVRRRWLLEDLRAIEQTGLAEATN